MEPRKVYVVGDHYESITAVFSTQKAAEEFRESNGHDYVEEWVLDETDYYKKYSTVSTRIEGDK